jgi:hypothetical protein
VGKYPMSRRRASVVAGRFGVVWRRAWRRLWVFGWVCVVGVAGCGLVAPGLASAAFVRPFERQIARSQEPVGELCSEAEARVTGTPCMNPAGLAVNGQGDVWVGNEGFSHEAFLDEFQPASGENAPITQFPVPGLEVAGSLAVEPTLPGDGEIYAAGLRGLEVFEADGTHVESWEGTKPPFSEPEPFNELVVAIDDSTSPLDPSACSGEECSVYVGSRRRVEKFNSRGVKVPFTAHGLDYVSGDEITGRPDGEGCGEGSKGFLQNDPSALAVDGNGDIYVGVPSCRLVFEYAPSGEFVRTFELAGAPRVGPGESVGLPVGLAFDEVTHHLLVAAIAEPAGAVVDEFEAEGSEAGRFVAEITRTPEGELQDPGAMAVDSSGDVYVVERGRHVVDVFGPGAYRPIVRVGAVAGRTATSAVVSGSVNPAQAKNPKKAPLTECFFEYVEEATYQAALAAKEEEGFPKAKAARVECSPRAATIPVEPEAETRVEARFDGLQAGKTYRYRLVATTEPRPTEPTVSGGTEQTEALAFTAPAAPEIVSANAEDVSGTSADLHARVDPLGAATSYWFEYGATSSYGHVVPALPGGEAAPVGIGAGGPTGSSVEGALQPIGGLEPGSTYHFRVVAKSECEAIERPGQECVSTGEDETFTTLPAAASSGRAYELVTPANKEGGSDMFAEPEGNGAIHNDNDVGTPSESGEAFVLVTPSSFGSFPFAQGGAYVFRRAFAAGDWSFTSLASPALGDQSSGAVPPLVEPFSFGRVALQDEVGSAPSEQGSRMTDLVGPPGAPNPPCAGEASLAAAVAAQCYIGMHQDQPVHGTTSKELTESTVPVGASSDLGHVVLSSHHTSLCPGGEKVKHGPVLCEWSGGYETDVGGEVVPQLQLVDVNPENESQPVSECGALLGSGTQGGHARSAVSAAGSRVFFTAPAPEVTGGGKCWNGIQSEEVEGPRNAPQSYARVAIEEAGEVTHRTFQISKPEEGVTEPGSTEPGKRPVQYPAIFLGASEDGSKVFFQTRTWMTQEHPAGHDAELYQCEIEVLESGPRCKLTRISVPIFESGAQAGQPDPAVGARTLFVPAISADGSTVYFTAFGVLAQGGQEDPEPGQSEGTPINLYRYDTLDHSTSYVTSVAAADFSNEADEGVECDTSIDAEPGTSSQWTAPCSRADWFTTRDGTFLLFGDSLPVAGNNVAADGCAETHLPSDQAGGDGRCSEVYRYDALAAEAGQTSVVCVSCGSEGPEGADAAGNAEFDRSSSNGPASPAEAGISENGEYVFFDSKAELTSQASNNTLDVYQWHEDLETHERSLALIGSGTNPGPTFFLGYSPYYLPDGTKVEGGNVFIGTHAKLSTAQTNSLGNIYDARICAAASPCVQPPPSNTKQCEGGSCQTPPPSPLFQTPATNTLASSGNITPAPTLTPPPKPTGATNTTKCKRGYVKKKIKKKERCVKAKPKKPAKKTSDNRRPNQ